MKLIIHTVNVYTYKSKHHHHIILYYIENNVSNHYFVLYENFIRLTTADYNLKQIPKFDTFSESNSV